MEIGLPSPAYTGIAVTVRSSERICHRSEENRAWAVSQRSRALWWAGQVMRVHSFAIVRGKVSRIAIRPFFISRRGNTGILRASKRIAGSVVDVPATVAYESAPRHNEWDQG